MNLRYSKTVTSPHIICFIHLLSARTFTVPKCILPEETGSFFYAAVIYLCVKLKTCFSSLLYRKN